MTGPCQMMEWDAFTAFAEEIRLEEQPDGSSEKPACTLYYSDGKQQQKKLDQETGEAAPGVFYRAGPVPAG